MAWDRPALAGIKVIDATSTAAGQFCGRLFADYGAEVILVERAGGEPRPGGRARSTTPARCSFVT